MTLEDRIIFIDGEALVLDKPAGLPVDPPRTGGPSIMGRIDELKCGFQRSPVAMHRLDQDTSGCLLFARNPKAVKRFQQAFEQHQVTKTYIAALAGMPKDGGTEGLIDLPLAKVSSKARGWRMVPDDAGKLAQTRWSLLGERDGRCLVQFEPLTGRTHQVRVHAARGLGAPIIGDPVYAAKDSDPEQAMLLHAWKLKVPREGKDDIDAAATIPDEFGLWLDFIDEA